MKYLLLIYSSRATWEALSARERERMERDHTELYHELVESGEWAGGNALADPVLGRSVQVRGGETMVTDGPYLEAKEHLAGYDLVQCDSLERATEIAARIPDAGICRVEVRPIMDLGGMEP